MENKVTWTQTFKSKIENFEYIEFEIIQLEYSKHDQFTHFARVLNGGREISYMFFDDFKQAKNFIIGAMYTLNGLGIIDMTEDIEG